MEQDCSWQAELIPNCVKIHGLPSDNVTQELKDYFKAASDFQIQQDGSGWKILVLFPQQKNADDLVEFDPLSIVLDDEDPEECTLAICHCKDPYDIPISWKKYSTKERNNYPAQADHSERQGIIPEVPLPNQLDISHRYGGNEQPPLGTDPNVLQPYGGSGPNYTWQNSGRDPNVSASYDGTGLKHSHYRESDLNTSSRHCLESQGPPSYRGPDQNFMLSYGQDPRLQPPYGVHGLTPAPMYGGPSAMSPTWYGFQGYQVQPQPPFAQNMSPQQSNAQHFPQQLATRQQLSPEQMPARKTSDDIGVATKDEISGVKSIFVSELPNHVKEEDLKKFFESNKKSSGGPVGQIEINHEKHTAIVTFQKAEVASRVLARRPILFKKTILEIEEYRVESETEGESEEDTTDTDESTMESDTGAKEDSSTIEIHGLSENTTSDTIMFYFENKRKSGGGNIKEFNLDAEKNIAIITFDDASVPEEVIRRKHVLDGKTLDIKLFVPPPPVQFCKDKVLLKGVNPDTSRDALENFLELKASTLPKSLIYGEEEGTILVTFEENIDFDAFASGCKKRKLEGRFLEATKVPVTNCVFVGNLSPKTTSDALEMFFENTRRSGGGVIQKVEISDEDNSCLIFFEDIQAVDSICDRRQLVLDDSTLTVHPHYPCLGQVSDCDGQAPVFKAPPPIEILDSDKILLYEFLYKQERKEVEQKLEAVNAQIEWPKQTEQMLVLPTLSRSTKNVKKIAKTWNDDVLQAMLKIEDCLKIVRLQILKEIWNAEFKAKIRSDTTSDSSSSVQVFQDDQSCEVTLIGYCEQVDQRAKLIKKSRLQAENEIERKKKRVKEEMSISIPKLILLCDLDTVRAIRQELPDLAVTVDKDRGKVLFEGQLTDIKLAQVKMYEVMNKISHIKMEKQFSNAASLFLRTDSVYQYLDTKMKEAGIRCSWEVFPNDSSIVVYSTTQPEIVQAADLIKAKVMEKFHPIDRLSISLLSKDPWKKICDNMMRKFPGMIQIEAEIPRCQIKILTLAEYSGEILETIDDFLAKNTIIEESMKLDPGVSKYLKQNKRDKITSIERKSSNGNVQINLSNEEMVIRGSKDELRLAKPLVANLAADVKVRCFPLDKPGIHDILQSDSGMACRRNIEMRWTCIIEISTTAMKESTRSSLRVSTLDSQPQLIATGTEKNGAVIKTFQGDITELKADVIVNAANSKMSHVGGLADFIVKKGGKSIQDECTRYVNQRGPLLDGDIYCSKPGNLKCKMIAHANSPAWQDGNHREEEYLNGVVWKSLEACDRDGYSSIAIPAVGTGIFYYPEDKATRCIIETTLEYLVEEIHTSVKEIYLCDINPSAVTCFTDELKRQLGETSVVNHKKPVEDQWKPIPQKQNMAAARNTSNLNVQIVKGQIASSMTDVIVNTTSSDLLLTNGTVSASILRAAGQSIQDECNVGYPDGIQHGKVATTSGGNLNCRSIFHGALENYKKNENAIQQFHDFIHRCLQMADDEMMTSISFPAIGTGVLGYPHDTVAAEMFRIVNDFKPTHLKDVHFVIYEKDGKSLKAFQQEETKWSSATGHSDSNVNRRQKRTFRSTSSVQQPNKANTSKSPGAPASTSEAEATFGPITVNIRIGDFTEADWEAIICPTDKYGSITDELTQCIHQKTGLNLNTEAAKKKKTLSRSGIACVPIKGKQSKVVILVNALEDSEKSLHLALTKAVEEGHKSVAVPVLSTAKKSSPGRNFGETLCKVITGTSFKSLEKIVVVLTRQIDFTDVTSTVEKYVKANKPGAFGKFWKNDMSFEYKCKEQSPTSRITLIIYGEDESSIQSAYKDVEFFCDKEITELVIDDPLIKDFSDTHRMRLGGFKESFGVEVIFEKRPPRIRLSGLPVNVKRASNEIDRMFMDIQRLHLTKEKEKITARCVEWSVILEGDDGTELQPYTENLNHKIENDYQQQQPKTSFTDDSGVWYEIDFSSMVEYPLDDQNDKAKVLRKDKLQSTQGAGVNLPPTWTPMTDQDPVVVIPIQSTDTEFAEVAKDFMATIGTSTPTIVKIERIQNQTLYQQYMAKKTEIDRNCSRQSDRMLWHGTAEGAVDSINMYGFNRSYCGKNATFHGDGVYFACESNYSARDTYSPANPAGHKKMYRCLVLTGEFTKGKEKMRVPPAKKGHILYDSVVDDEKNPKMFIVFNDTQAYPEYLITFTT